MRLLVKGCKSSCFPSKWNFLRNCFVDIMAELDNEDDVPKLISFVASNNQIDSSEQHNHVKHEEESFTRPGALLDDKQVFTNKKGDTIRCYPVIVDFRRLLQLTGDASRTRLQEFGIIPGVIFVLKLFYFAVLSFFVGFACHLNFR